MIVLHNRIEIAQEFANAINSDEIIRMILFGSVARGDDNDESDIDILIVIHHDNRELESIIDNIVVDFILEKENPYREVFSPSRSMLHLQLFLNGFEAITNLLTPTTKRCPHMGCALKWNKHEQSWDCPCHGSRFKKDGSIIDNPATDNFNTERS